MENDLLKTFRYKKNLGQNFITDKNILKAIVSDAGVTEQDDVVEIGTGAATLTACLADKARSVLSFEVDEELIPLQNQTLAGRQNVRVIFRDVLKTTDEELKEWVPETFKVVANLPYYVTTPMIMRFAESDLNVTSMTLMMQKEVGDRLVAEKGTPEYGAITVALEAVANVKIVREVSRRLFYPVPNVDSVVVRLDFDKNKYVFSDFSLFKKTVKAAFCMRRKTLVNNLVSAFSLPKETAERVVTEAGFSPLIRGEALTCADLIKVSDALALALCPPTRP